MNEKVTVNDISRISFDRWSKNLLGLTPYKTCKEFSSKTALKLSEVYKSRKDDINEIIFSDLVRGCAKSCGEDLDKRYHFFRRSIEDDQEFRTYTVFLYVLECGYD